MFNLIDLYKIADRDNITVDCFDLRYNQSLSIMDINENCYIAIDPMQLKSEKDEKVKLAHELGHCETGAFYNRNIPLDIMQKHEYKANRWAVTNLVPKDQLTYLLKNGYEKWDIAEYFDVTEDFINLAIRMYFEYGIAV